MVFRRLLIANRGEIAIRIARAAAEMEIETVGIYSTDDAGSLHVRRVDKAVPLDRAGAAAYLEVEAILAVAKEQACGAIHPGYGFLSENASFAARCAEAGIVFVGPSVATLETLGDKGRAKDMAAAAGIPILAGTRGPTGLDEVLEFFDSLGERAAIAIKAIAGGGGRGMRLVERRDDIRRAYERCQSEAEASFGVRDVYVEQLVRRARHIEVQVLGDGSGEVTHLWERDCSLQRRHQKLVEIAPAPALAGAVSDKIIEAAVTMARHVRYSGAGTFEFLVDLDSHTAGAPVYYFIEANPRLQVEHTVTEEVTGVDIVQAQLALAAGRSLQDLGLTQSEIPEPRGFAVQFRVNMERVREDGSVLPATGRLELFEPPAGPGIRVDTYGYTGFTPGTGFDSLLAKLVVSGPSNDFAAVLRRSRRALDEFRIEGIETNLAWLRNVAADPEVAAANFYTRYLEDHAGDLARLTEAGALPGDAPPGSGTSLALAGTKVDPNDPLAVLAFGKTAATSVNPPPAAAEQAPGTVVSPLQGTIVSVAVTEGATVRAGEELLVMEAMKMEHVVAAEASGTVRRIHVAPGDTVYEGVALVSIEPQDLPELGTAEVTAFDLDHVRPDLAEVEDRHKHALDAYRPEAVASRQATAQRTARANVLDLVDDGSFVEYGQLVIAAQRQKRPLQELIERTPADGLITGIGNVNAELFGPEKSKCVVMAYDYTVLAGTQGQQNHRKHDRMFELAEELRIPLVFFTEGGGGRAGDSDSRGVSGLRGTLTFRLFGKLSGLVPLVGVNSGRCFAGNAALLGACDVVIATENSNIGMGGPALVEGGGLGVFRPEEIGPMAVQVPNGVVDVVAADEVEAVALAKKYLSYFQGRTSSWDYADQRLLRSIIPENRLRVYDVRAVIETMADTGSVLELRAGFGRTMVTALARVEGRPVGIIANNARFLSGAIDSDGADKAARFLQLCDAFDIPVVSLCDTPGIMVGPEAEKTALVRHCNRLFVTSANLSVPFVTIVLRKGYGLGAMAMAGGTFKAPASVVAWPTGEFGGMGLEGQVKLGYRKELESIDDPAGRRARYEQLVADAYENGKALNFASHFEIDDVIDPADSRRHITTILEAAGPPPARTTKKRPFIDTW